MKIKNIGAFLKFALCIMIPAAACIAYIVLYLFYPNLVRTATEYLVTFTAVAVFMITVPLLTYVIINILSNDKLTELYHEAFEVKK